MNKPNSAAEALMSLWQKRDSMPFDRWIRSVDDAYEKSFLNLESAARLINANPAELEGALQLAGLEDAELGMLAECRPPSTTWFKFAKLNPQHFAEGIAALKSLRPGEPPSSALVQFDAVEIAVSRASQVGALPAEVFKHLASKAKQYNLLYDKARAALFSFGQRRDKGLELSAAQANWADSLIAQMIERGAIMHASPDNDQDICNKVLELYGSEAKHVHTQGH